MAYPNHSALATTASLPMPAHGYNERAMAAHRANHPAYHSLACNTASVDAFCNNLPDPGCICGAANPKS